MRKFTFFVLLVFIGFVQDVHSQGMIQKIHIAISSGDTTHVEQTLNVGGKPFDIIAYGANTLWVANYDLGQIQEVHIGASSGDETRITNTVTVDGHPIALAAYGTNTLWVANENGTIQKIHIAISSGDTTHVEQTLNVGGKPFDIIGYGANTLWVANYDLGQIQEVHIGASSGDETRITNTVTVDGHPIALAAYGANTLWVANENGTIQKMHIAISTGDTTHVEQTLNVGGKPFDIIGYGVNTLWVANYDLGQIQEVHIGASSGDETRITNTVTVDGHPIALASYGTNTLWVANENGTIQKIHIAISSGDTTHVEQTLNVGGKPFDIIAYGTNTLWVASMDTPRACYSTESIQFGIVDPGAVMSKEFSLENCGGDGLIYEEIYLETNDPDGIWSINPVGELNTEMEASSLQTITLTLTVPENAIGDTNYNCIIKILTNDQSSTVEKEIACSAKVRAIPAISVSPSRIEFPDTYIQSFSKSPITINNEGNVSLSIEIESDHPRIFEVTDPNEINIQIDQTHRHDIVFKVPRFLLRPITYSGKIKIFGMSSGSTVTREIDLIGTGQPLFTRLQYLILAGLLVMIAIPGGLYLYRRHRRRFTIDADKS